MSAMPPRDRLSIRLFDILAALGGGLAALPLILVAGALVRMDSPGPALFRQERVGRHGRPFICLKLRTMSQGTPVAGTHEVSAAAVTPIGRWLRRLKIDELPQLWNVLKGEMSLVGPRPCLPSQHAVIEERRARGVYEVRPGVTGLAQITGIDMSMPVALAEADSVWAANPNLKDYFSLILRTASGQGQGDRIREAA